MQFFMPRACNLEGFFLKVGESLLSRGFVIVLGLLRGVMLARFLGPAGRGALALAESVLSVGTTMGVLSQNISSLHQLGKDKNSLGKLIGNSLSQGIIFGAFLVLISVPILSAFPGILRQYGMIVWMAIAAIPFSIIACLFRSLLIGAHRVFDANVISVSKAIVEVLLLAPFCYFFYLTPNVAFIIQFLSLTVPLLLTWRILRKLAVDITPSLSLIRNVFGLGMRAHCINIFQMIIFSADFFMIFPMLGIREAGIYSLAEGGPAMLHVIPNVGLQILLTHISAIENFSERSKFAILGSLFLLAIVAIIGLPFGVFMRPIVSLFYGNEFLGAVMPAQMLILVALLYCASEATLTLYYTIGVPRFIIATWGIAAAIKLVSNWFLISKFGLAGAALSTICCFIFILILSLIHMILSCSHSFELKDPS